MAVRISKRVVDTIEATGREHFIWDTDLPGFGIRVRSGGAASYVAQYRLPGGRGAPSRRLTIGQVGKLTPDEARKLAREKLAEVAMGGDPAGEKAERRTGLTVNELADAFLERHAKPKRRASTAAYYEAILVVHVRPAVGSRRALDLSRQDVARLHGQIAAKRATSKGERQRRVLGGPFVANRALAVIGAMYTWGGKAGLLPEGTNPATKIEKFREEGRERYLTPDEIERLGAALRDAETIGLPYSTDETSPNAKHAPKEENRRTIYSPHVTGAVRLLMFTGCRLREILNLEWAHVDLARGVLFLPTSKTGKKTVVLAAPAAAILSSLPRIGRYVIASESAGTADEKPRHDIKKPWARLVAHAGLPGLRLHDLRHTFASIGAGANLGLPLIGKLLGHTQARTTAKYSHLAIDPLRRAADLVAGEIAAQLNGAADAEMPPANVVRLQTSKGDR